jgi:hypothetical protein
MNNLNWVKSSYSGGQSANCVEVAALPGGGRAVRDSKDPAGVVLLLSPAQWLCLVEQGLVEQGLVKSAAG